jgi:WD40-like Beta Propeller Repeat
MTAKCTPAEGALASSVAISRDGSRVAYRTQRGKGTQSDAVLYVHEVGTLDVRLLPGTDGAGQPFFSPDGESVAYFDYRDRRLKRVSVRGGRGLQRVPAVGGNGERVRRGPPGKCGQSVPRLRATLFHQRAFFNAGILNAH